MPIHLPVISSFYRKLGAMSLSRYISIGSALLAAIVLTRLLDEDVYGAYRKMWLIYAVIGASFVNCIANTLFYRGKSGDKSAAIGANLLLGLSFGLITASLAFFFAPFWADQLNVPDLADGFRMFAPYMAFAVFAGIAEPMFVVLERKKWLLAYAASYNSVEICLIVIPFALGWPIQDVLLIMAIGPMLRSLVIVAIAFRNAGPFSLKSIRAELPVSINYGVGILAMSFVGIATVEADKWIVSIFFESDALFAIYAVGAKKIPFITALTAAAAAALVTQYAGKMNQGDFSGFLTEARKASSRISLIVIPLIAVLFVFAEEVMVLLFEKYADSAPIFRIYLLVIVTQLVFPQSILLGAGKSHVVARYGIIELVTNVGLSILLIAPFGLLGPAYATLAGHILIVILLSLHAAKAFGISPTEILPDGRIRPIIWGLPVVAVVSGLLKYSAGLSLSGLIIAGAFSGVIILAMLRIQGFHKDQPGPEKENAEDEG